jgi:gamma-glutamylcyclotransferase (GGCT)/AIG2-like uncharacterized protein YtfP
MKSEPTENRATLERLFVYGTLRSDSPHAMARQLRRASHRWVPARFQGVKFDLGAYPGVHPSHDPADWIAGELFSLRRPVHRILRVLDAYEGVPEGLYSRRALPVQLMPGREQVAAWVYIYEGPLPG